MKKGVLFPLIAVTILCFACSRDDRRTNAFGDDVKEAYQSGGPLKIEELALYTNAGRITDTAIIRKYLDVHIPDRQEPFRRLFLVDAPIKAHTISVSMDFLADNKVRVNTRLAEIIQKTDTSMLLGDIDSSSMPLPQDDLCGKLHDSVPAISPFSQCAVGNCVWYRETYPIIIEKGKYYLPNLYYMSSNTHVAYTGGLPVTVSCMKIAQRYPYLNFVNKRLAAAIGPNDTVLIQRARVELKKHY